MSNPAFSKPRPRGWVIVFSEIPLLAAQAMATAIVVLLTVFLGVMVSGFAAAPAQANPLAVPPIVAAGSLFSFAGERPTTLGIQEGALAPCAKSPNCVSSQSSDKNHRIEPLQYDGPLDAAIAHLKAIIEDMPRVKVIQATDDYIYAEFTSALMGFVDDVEFYLDPDKPVIQVRSASRLGESDMGVNRKRIEAIRKKLNGLLLPS